MSNLVLYRKYRPKTFSEVVGQEHIVRTLTNALKEGLLSHGYLFCGPHGTGKTTIARLMAKALNCKSRKEGEAEPCNQCDSCLEINQGNAIDLIEIDAATATGIDNIRELKDGIRFVPVKSKYKVFIIDECHGLSKDAANALLKTLEEPPSHAIFILATTTAHKMIPTIQSRCQRFDFRKLRLPEIVGRLEKILEQEKIKSDKEALNLIAAYASGSVRDAESLLDEAVSFSGRNGKVEQETVRVLLGLSDKSTLFQFLGFLQKKQAKEAIELINEIIFKGVDLKEFARSLLQYLREALILQIDSATEDSLFLTLTEEEKKQLLDLSASFSEQALHQIIEKFMEAENKMRYATILQLPLELAIVDVCLKNQPAPLETPRT